jgi:SecD/SecF fusion protein
MFWQAILPLAQAADAPLNDSLSLGVKFLIVLAIIAGSFAAGVFLSRWLRMPDYGWKIGLVLLALTSGVAITVLGWPPKLGIDLSGGVILVYEVDQEKKGDQTIDMNEMVAAIARRINPGGTKEITIRPYGAEQIEIIIPEVDDDEVRRIEKIITNIGSLEFRIIANQTDHADEIERALALPLSVKELKTSDGTPIFRWVEVEHKPATLEYFSNPRFGNRTNAQGNLETLVKIDKFNVTGSDLAQAMPTERNGRPAVEFGFTSRGAAKFGGLTGANLPDPATGHERQLGIILDDYLVSAPNIKSVITDRGEITGEFTQQEVNDLVGVLRAGKLPAALEKTPSTRLLTGPTLGEDTIRSAQIATAAAMFVVVAFMVIYYRFAGVVASFALIINFVLTVAAMILIKAAFTLTGVAGLALTLGMAVDANVLIYERIREELGRGATLRMAIRNGFDRAMSAIIDSNLTTLITAVVLYVVGTDQIKGFAVTLTLGLLISLFTAIFVSRVVLDVVEKQRWITTLKMMQFVGVTNIDLIGKWRMAAALSLTLVAIGTAAVVARGKNILDIDFLGGTSIQILFKEQQNIAEIREQLNNVPEDIRTQIRSDLAQTMTEELRTEARQELGADASQQDVDALVEQKLDELSDLRDVAVSGVQIPGEEPDVRFQFNTSNPSIRAVETIVKDLFAGELAHNSMTYEPIAMISAEEARKAGAAQRSAPTSTSTGENGSTPVEKPADSPTNTPSTPESSDNSSIRPGDERLLAMADVQGELALLAQNDNNQPASTGSSATTASDNQAEAGKSESASSQAGSSEQFAKTTLKFAEPVTYDSMVAKLKNALDAADVTAEFNVSNPQYSEGSNVPYDTWEVRIGASQEQSEQVLKTIQQDLDETPVFPASSNIGGKVAGSTRLSAIYALLASLVLIVGYIWLRFERAVFGLAAVVALVHDVTISTGAVAISYYIANLFGPVAAALQIDPFKIDLTIVAALLTIVGYSLNDTIVVFDRIREVRGKSPHLTRDMLNLSINQTLSRTILTGLTTMFVLIILYFWGGQGIHGFAYCLLVGMVVGTYSSIYVASPVLLWLMQPRQERKPELAAAGGRGPNYAKSIEERRS